ncbi:hypothetical protein [Methylorubrum extorquens]|uniref:hypothetical protein n=1 Tax=Methylorubrum extorquens TaxID=408 RepID=UPI0015FD1745|nr:hypothetical protein [Methylorubrum extorquens]MBA9067139.1 hypothetical protein [Methylobacterium sp. RAS18]UYW26099.1 hypothetical protein OKC48_22965 [Methylorubrum extorquens]UYW34096.1 hypothetical protein OKB92_08455 [Methylorubrum extorquens]
MLILDWDTSRFERARGRPLAQVFEDCASMVARMTSESNGNEVAVHDLSHDPERLAEMLPAGAGPWSSTKAPGLPRRRSRFSRTYCELARASGCPDGIWNMDSRAGSMSEACEAGAVPDNVMRTATPTPISTKMLKNRGLMIPSVRAAELRTARRKAKLGG